MKLYDKKNFIRDIIEKVIIKERSEVEVLCHIPLPQLALTSAHKLGHEPISRDRTSHSTTLDFKFDLLLPSPRKVRIITEWDDYGRIVRPIPSEILFEVATNSIYRVLQN